MSSPTFSTVVFLVLLLVLLGAIPILSLFAGDEPDNESGKVLGEQRPARSVIPLLWLFAGPAQHDDTVLLDGQPVIAAVACDVLEELPEAA